MNLFFWLVVGHCVADYPGQGDFLSKAKNHRSPIPGIDWQIALMAHAMIHAGVVAYLTGSLVCGMIEFAVHCVIDWLKCEGDTTFRADQILHIICKVMYAYVFG